MILLAAKQIRTAGVHIASFIRDPMVSGRIHAPQGSEDLGIPLEYAYLVGLFVAVMFLTEGVPPSEVEALRCIRSAV